MACRLHASRTSGATNKTSFTSHSYTPCAHTYCTIDTAHSYYMYITHSFGSLLHRSFLPPPRYQSFKVHCYDALGVIRLSRVQRAAARKVGWSRTAKFMTRLRIYNVCMHFVSARCFSPFVLFCSFSCAFLLSPLRPARIFHFDAGASIIRQKYSTRGIDRRV